MSTEWDDAQRRIGNLPPIKHEVEIDQDLFERLVIAQAERKASHIDDTPEELDEACDNAEDDEESALEKIRWVGPSAIQSASKRI
jgi:hypothetical protein